MKRTIWFLLVLTMPALLVCSVPLPGTNTNGPPEQAAQEWIDAIVNQDGNRMLKYTCLAQREDVQQASMWFSAFAVLGQLFTNRSVQIEGDISDLKFETVNQNGDQAEVRVYGELRVAVLGSAQAQQVDERWQMIYENDTWRWCGSSSGTLPMQPTNTPSQQMAAATPPKSMCNPEWKSHVPSNVNEAALRQMATDILTSYFGGDKAKLQQYLDGSQLISSIAFEAAGVTAEVEDVVVCGVWGNEKLVSLPATVSLQMQGKATQLSTLIFLRNSDAGWHLITIVTDVEGVIRDLDGFYKVSTWFADQLKTGSGAIAQPQPAIVLSPENGQYPQPSGGERFGDFVWQPSPSTNVLVEVIEFEYGFGTRVFFRPRSEQEAASDRISAGNLLTTNSEWHWRVWSITDEGTVAFSEARSFVH